MQVVSAISANSSDTHHNVSAFCPAGKNAIGGGAFLNPSQTVPGLAVQASYPVLSAGRPLGWTVVAAETLPYDGSWTVTAYAICATVAP